MPQSAEPLRLTQDQFHAALSRAQGLSGEERSVTAAVERFGFVRTLGGIDVYLAVRARVPELRRGDTDNAMRRRVTQLRELDAG